MAEKWTEREAYDDPADDNPQLVGLLQIDGNFKDDRYLECLSRSRGCARMVCSDKFGLVFVATPQGGVSCARFDEEFVQAARDWNNVEKNAEGTLKQEFAKYSEVKDVPGLERAMSRVIFKPLLQGDEGKALCAGIVLSPDQRQLACFLDEKKGARVTVYDIVGNGDRAPALKRKQPLVPREDGRVQQVSWGCTGAGGAMLAVLLETGRLDVFDIQHSNATHTATDVAAVSFCGDKLWCASETGRLTKLGRDEKGVWSQVSIEPPSSSERINVRSMRAFDRPVPTVLMGVLWDSKPRVVAYSRGKWTVSEYGDISEDSNDLSRNGVAAALAFEPLDENNPTLVYLCSQLAREIQCVGYDDGKDDEDGDEPGWNVFKREENNMYIARNIEDKIDGPVGCGVLRKPIKHPDAKKNFPAFLCLSSTGRVNLWVLTGEDGEKVTLSEANSLPAAQQQPEPQPATRLPEPQPARPKPQPARPKPQPARPIPQRLPSDWHPSPEPQPARPKPQRLLSDWHRPAAKEEKMPRKAPRDHGKYLNLMYTLMREVRGMRETQTALMEAALEPRRFRQRALNSPSSLNGALSNLAINLTKMQGERREVKNCIENAEGTMLGLKHALKQTDHKSKLGERREVKNCIENAEEASANTELAEKLQREIHRTREDPAEAELRAARELDGVTRGNNAARAKRIKQVNTRLAELQAVVRECESTREKSRRWLGSVKALRSPPGARPSPARGPHGDLVRRIYRQIREIGQQLTLQKRNVMRAIETKRLRNSKRREAATGSFSFSAGAAAGNDSWEGSALVEKLRALGVGADDNADVREDGRSDERSSAAAAIAPSIDHGYRALDADEAVAEDDGLEAAPQPRFLESLGDEGRRNLFPLPAQDSIPAERDALRSNERKVATPRLGAVNAPARRVDPSPEVIWPAKAAIEAEESKAKESKAVPDFIASGNAADRDTKALDAKPKDDTQLFGGIDLDISGDFNFTDFGQADGAAGEAKDSKSQESQGSLPVGKSSTSKTAERKAEAKTPAQTEAKTPSKTTAGEPEIGSKDSKAETKIDDDQGLALALPVPDSSGFSLDGVAGGAQGKESPDKALSENAKPSESRNGLDMAAANDDWARSGGEDLFGGGGDALKGGAAALDGALGGQGDAFDFGAEFAGGGADDQFSLGNQNDNQFMAGAGEGIGSIMGGAGGMQDALSNPMGATFGGGGSGGGAAADSGLSMGFSQDAFSLDVPGSAGFDEVSQAFSSGAGAVAFQSVGGGNDSFAALSGAAGGGGNAFSSDFGNMGASAGTGQSASWGDFSGMGGGAGGGDAFTELRG